MRALAAAVIFAAIVLPAQEPARPLSAKAKAVMKEMGHGEGKLKPGDVAHDFKLRRVKSKKKIKLSAFRGKKPVALGFESYT